MLQVDEVDDSTPAEAGRPRQPVTQVPGGSLAGSRPSATDQPTERSRAVLTAISTMAATARQVNSTVWVGAEEKAAPGFRDTSMVSTWPIRWTGGLPSATATITAFVP